jgi:hypothetical protein
MVFFLIIPLALLAITIAIAPVLAMTIVECRSEAGHDVRPQVRTDRSEYSRIQLEFAGLHPVGYPGRTTGHPAAQPADDGRSRAA